MDIGAHCAVGSCHQQDFLPFTCDCCASVFCLDHRSYDAHECPSAGSNDRRVLECPVCRDLVHWTMEQDVNVVWEDHVRVKQCTSERFQRQLQHQQATKKKKKERCAADKCREILVPSNRFHCTACNQQVCLKHRFENDHDCHERRQQLRKHRVTAAKRASTTTATRRPSSAQLQQNAKTAAATVVQGATNAVSSLVQNAKSAAATASAAASNAITTNSEECPMCHQKFPYVSQLIAHVNRAHPETNARNHTTARAPPAAAPATATSAGQEVCPQCRAVFSDVTALIQHVESAHAGVAVSAGTPADQDNGKCQIM